MHVKNHVLHLSFQSSFRYSCMYVAKFLHFELCGLLQKFHTQQNPLKMRPVRLIKHDKCFFYLWIELNIDLLAYYSL